MLVGIITDQERLVNLFTIVAAQSGHGVPGARRVYTRLFQGRSGMAWEAAEARRIYTASAARPSEKRDTSAGPKARAYTASACSPRPKCSRASATRKSEPVAQTSAPGGASAVARSSAAPTVGASATGTA